MNPAFVHSTPQPSIYRYFGLPISEKELEYPEIHSVDALRANGEIFQLRISILSSEGGIITAKLIDENDYLSDSSQSFHIERMTSSSSIIQSSIGSSSVFGGIAVDISTLNETNPVPIGSDEPVNSISLAISFLIYCSVFLHQTLFNHSVSPWRMELFCWIWMSKT